jgi:hypothetical protein
MTYWLLLSFVHHLCIYILFYQLTKKLKKYLNGHTDYHDCTLVLILRKNIMYSTIFVLYNKFLNCCCLEQVLSCEQKLYTRSQLSKHIKGGDSEVDGKKNERRGFLGHPMCEFCKIPFYGNNELYTHVTREHYSCHICQRCSATVILLDWT